MAAEDRDENLLNKLKFFLEDTKDDWNYILPEDFEKQRKKKDFFILDTYSQILVLLKLLGYDVTF